MSHILIAEDFEAVRRLITKALELEGHTVDGAVNGAEAIALFVDNTYDLVLTDMEMPHLSGQELIAEIHNLSPHTPIIGMTGGPLPESIEQERQRLKIAALFVKPLDLETLRSTIRELTTETVPIREPVPITNPAV